VKSHFVLGPFITINLVFGHLVIIVIFISTFAFSNNICMSYSEVSISKYRLLSSNQNIHNKQSLIRGGKCMRKIRDW
jgi:hypothetical protein